jgi:ribonuclease HIII
LITGIYTSSNRIGVKVKTKNTEALQTVYSANNTYTVGAYADYKFERRGSTLSVYFNNVVVITVALPTDFSDVIRNFRLGTEAAETYRAYGRFDDFNYVIY